MAVLHIFNPSHDEALAANTPYYTPTAAARRLASDLARLPAVWAAPGDSLLLPDGRQAVSCRDLDAPRPVDAAFWDTITEVAPWGWDAPLAELLRRRGCPDALLPSTAHLADLRRLSGRQHIPTLLRHIRHGLVDTVGEAVWCTSLDGVERARLAYGGEAMVKAPWSCSGRGVFRLAMPTTADVQRMTRLLQRQGGLEVEPFYRRRADMAMEFRVEADGRVCYEGLSLFTTSDTGNYSGNIVADEAALYAALPAALRPTLDAVRRRWPALLAAHLGGRYRGPVGIDMMVVEADDGRPLLHPCVEVNVRRTMGWVALALRRHLSPPHPRGRYTLRPVAAAPAATTGHVIRLTPHASVIEAVLLF
jgi:hypothetical protein